MWLENPDRFIFGATTVVGLSVEGVVGVSVKGVVGVVRPIDTKTA